MSQVSPVVPKVKICGMRESVNIGLVAALQPDYLGFIFYEKSPRYVGEELDAEQLKAFPRQIRKVGVFVNAHPDFILRMVRKYSLDLVQLHGTEPPEVCRNLRGRGISLIKAFSIDEQFNFSRLNNYKPFCDYFLFDTKGESFGGNGTTFNWELLRKYDNEKPFFLSGGISPEHAPVLHELRGLNIHAFDINSRFEVKPGLKDVQKLKEFIQQIRKPLQTAA
ncbi:MAG: phosphoribosylanthranilate isomerase [Cytophagales bacterium]|nr:phosphoribosylanthranilate isomerase [Cytophagales bacterium]